MNMLADDDGTFPRVSELSIRLEQEKNIQKIDNYSQEVYNQVLQERKRIAAERDKLMNLEVTEDSGFNQNANPDMFYSMPDHEVFKGVIISTNSRAAADKKFDNFAYDSYKEQTDLEKKKTKAQFTAWGEPGDSFSIFFLKKRLRFLNRFRKQRRLGGAG